MFIPRYTSELSDEEKEGMKILLSQRFLDRMGKEIDWDNPVTFNEKINWLKVYDHSSLKTHCADKIAVRDYVRYKLGQEFLIPTYYIGYDVNSINPKNITANKFVAKVNHDNGGVYVCEDRQSFDFVACREFLLDRLQMDYSDFSLEMQYRDIKRGYIVEKFIESGNPLGTVDYKFVCFNGKPRYLFVATRKPCSHITHYTLDWERMPFRYEYDVHDCDFEKPKNLNFMIDAAQKISKDFKFVRVDMFKDVEDNVYVGELTFHPGSGYNDFEPKSWDTIIGKEMNL